MVEKSSRRGCYRSDGGYDTEESEKENSRRHNTRSRADKQKFDDVNNKPPRAGYDEKWSPAIKFDPDEKWSQSKEKWFKRMDEKH